MLRYIVFLTLLFSGATATAAHCGGYDAAGPGTLSYADALLIPMAQLPAGTLLQNGNFCGQGKAFIGNMAGTAMKYNQICCKCFGKVMSVYVLVTSA